jgi:hypothetical protein
MIMIMIIFIIFCKTYLQLRKSVCDIIHPITKHLF